MTMCEFIYEGTCLFVRDLESVPRVAEYVILNLSTLEAQIKKTVLYKVSSVAHYIFTDTEAHKKFPHRAVLVVEKVSD